jgi:hypothetical protein
VDTLILIPTLKNLQFVVFWTGGQTEKLIRGGVGNLVGSSMYTHCAWAGEKTCAIVSVFWLWQEIFFGVTYTLRLQYKLAHSNGIWRKWTMDR